MPASRARTRPFTDGDSYSPYTSSRPKGTRVDASRRRTSAISSRLSSSPSQLFDNHRATPESSFTSLSGQESLADCATHHTTPTDRFFTNPITIDGVTLRPTVAFRTFWYWCAERKAIDDRRRAGEPAPWTRDRIMQKHFFCNSYRVLDKLSQYLISEVIERGDQSEEEIVFRVVLFNLFTKIETWELLEEKLGPLTWKHYNRTKYADVLHCAAEAGQTLYTCAFIKPAPKIAGQPRGTMNYEGHLTFLEWMMSHELYKKCMNSPTMADLFDWLEPFPSMGLFSAYQLMLCLSYTKVLNFHQNDFVVVGPGSRSGLSKLFGSSIGGHLNNDGFCSKVMRYLAENQENFFALGSFDFQGLGPKKLPLGIADIEHSLCEVDKYCRLAHPQLKAKRTNLHRSFVTKEPRKPLPPLVLPRAWNDRRRRIPRVNEEHVFVKDRRWEIDYIVEHRIAAEKGMQYLVRWAGFGPRDDTWEDHEHLILDAPKAIEEYKKKHKLE